MHTEDNEQFIIPNNLAELQQLTQDLWHKIFFENDISQIPIYNEAAEKYNKQAKFVAITIIDNFKKQQQMATKKEVAATTKKSAKLIDTVVPAAEKKKAERAAKKDEKPAVEKAPVEKVAKAEKPAAEKPAVEKAPVEKAASQKTQVVELAEQGKGVDEIVEATGIKKTNVQWYFSKLNFSWCFYFDTANIG